MKNHAQESIKHIMVTLLCILGLTALPYQPAQAVPTTFTVTNTSNSGAGSLRQAILDANSTPGQDVIVFNIPTSDPYFSTATGEFIIGLLGGLPALTDLTGTIIDGTTQTSNVGNTNTLGPEIELRNNLPFSEPIFIMQEGNNTIKGLSLYNELYVGIDVYNFSHNNTITQNYIGINAKGNACGGNTYGIRVGSQNNIINNNVISCSKYDAIQIHSTASLNQIVGNTIGLNAQINIIGNLTGPDDYGNDGNGIAIFSSDTNTISDNIISHNGKSGIMLQDSKWTTIQRNLIGINDTDTSTLGNKDYGILLEDFSIDNFIKDNYVAGNGRTGIYLTGYSTWGNQLEHNVIGVNKNYQSIPNGHHGIGIYNGSYDNIIGDLSDPGLGNQIYSSSWSGIAIVNDANWNTIAHNLIGDLPNLGNNYHGIAIVNSFNNLIAWNTIAGNGASTEAAGVLVDGVAADHNRMIQNSIYDNNNTGIKIQNNGNEGILPPTIISATCDTVNGTACPGCTVEIFSDYGSQGRYFEGRILADSVGVYGMVGSLHGPNNTATQTDSKGNTSIFSLPYKNVCTRIFLPFIDGTKR